MKPIIRLFGQSRMAVGFLFVISVIAGIVPPLVVQFESGLINSAILVFQGKESEILSYVIALLVALLLNAGTPIVKEYLRGRLKLSYEEEYQNKIVRKVQKIPYELLELPTNADLLTRVSKDIDIKASDYVIQIFELLTVIITVSGYLYIVFSASALSGCVFTFLLVFLLFFANKAAKAFYKSNSHFTQTERRVTYLDSLVNTKDYAYEKKLFDYTEHITQIRDGHLMNQRNSMRKLEFKFGMLFASIDSVGYWCTLINMLSMIPAVVAGSMSVGLAVSIIRASLNLNLTTQSQLRELLERLLEQKLFWKDYDRFMAMEEREQEEKTGQKLVELAEITFRHVYFNYPNGKQVLNNVNFTLKQGRHYAVVGENGSGKTTVVKLMLGLYAPTSGEILINGKNISTYTGSQLSDIFSVVFQDYARYSLTVEENIVFGRNMDNKKFESVVCDAEMNNLIDKLENREKTMLGQSKIDGIDISGGEWQKIALARALYTDGKMLVLDEPTASLDPITESRIYEKYDRLTFGKMSLFITHRLASAALADEILVLADGRVMEIGLHNELMEKDSLYRKMYLTQRKWYYNEDE